MHRSHPLVRRLTRLRLPLLLVTLLALLGSAASSAQEARPSPPALNATSRLYLPIVTTAPGSIAPAKGYSQTFDGKPASPQPWQPADWDITVHSRDGATWGQLEPMQAMHGADCGAPPATHLVSRYEDAVFQCRDHIMTAINAGGYGLIYLTPNQLVDFSQGEAVIRWDMSTLRTSSRDWAGLWITPYNDNLQLPLETWLPDLTGMPRNSVHLRLDFVQNAFYAEISRNFRITDLKAQTNWTGYERFLTPDAARRDTFEVRISRTRLRVGMPQYNFWWIDTSIADLGWDQGVVQFGHHSYNPSKACDVPGACGPNTWHWDNVTITPTKPFTIIRADRRAVTREASSVSLAQPAPANAHLRFAGIGPGLELSFDGGRSWQLAQTQAQDSSLFKDEHFRSYWTPIPPGSSQVLFRGQSWWGGDWHIRDISVWAPPA